MPEIGLRVVIVGAAEARRQIGAFQSDVTRLGRVLSGSAAESNKFSAAMTNVGGQLTQLGTAITGVGRSLTFGLTLPLTALIGALTNAGMEFEDAFAGVSKTVDGVADDFGNLTDLGMEVRQEFRDMALTIPIAATELARIGQVAGQLGVEATPIINGLGTELGHFTEIVAKMGATTDLSTEEAAFAFARLANIMGEGDNMVEFANGLSNAIVDLGNNAAATEPEIVNLAMRIASAGRVVGMSTQEVLGFATGMAELGVRAEMGGTAISRVMQEMFLAVSSGVETVEVAIEGVDSSERAWLERTVTRHTRAQQALAETSMAYEAGLISADDYAAETEKATQTIAELDAVIAALEPNVQQAATAMVQASGPLVTFATISGQSVEEFSRAFREDAAGAVIHFVERLAIMQEEGRISKDMLTEIGAGGVRVRDVLNRMGGDLSIITDNIERANRAWEEQTALQIEYQKRIATVKSQLQLLSNQFKDLGIEIFDLVKDGLSRFIAGVSAVIQYFRELSPETQRTILLVGSLAAAIGPLLVVIGGLVSGLGLFITSVGAISAVVGSAIAPILAVTAALAGLLAVLLAFTPLGDPVKDFFDKIRTTIDNYIAGEGFPPINIPLVPTVEEGEVEGGDEVRAPNVPVVNVVPRTLAEGPTNVRNLPEGIDFGPGQMQQSATDLSDPSVQEELRAQSVRAITPEPEEAVAGWEAALAPVREKIDEFINGISLAFDRFGVKGILIRLGFTAGDAQIIVGIFDTIKEAVNTAVEVFTETFNEVNEIVNTTRENLAKELGFESMAINWETVKEAITTALVVIGAVIAVVLGIIAGLIGGIISAATVIWGALQSIGQSFAMIFTSIVNIVTGVIAIIKKLFQGDFRGAAELIPEVLQNVVNYVKGLFGLFVSIVTGAIGAVVALVAGFVTTIIGFFTGLFNSLVGNSIIPDMMNAIVRVFTDKLEAVKEVVRGAIERIKSIWTGLKNAVGRIIDGIGDTIDKIGTKTTEVKGAVSRAVGGIKGAFESLRTWFSNNIDRLLGPIRQIAEEAGRTLGLITDSPELKIQHAFERLEEYLQQADFSMTLPDPRLAYPGISMPSDGMRGGNVSNVSYTANVTGAPIRDEASLARELVTSFKYMRS